MWIRGMVQRKDTHFNFGQCGNIILRFILSGSILYTMYESYLRVGATLFHCLFMYTIGMTAIISSNVFYILSLLIFMIGVKYAYYLFDRCILTYLEDGRIYPSGAQLFNWALTDQNIKSKTIEEITINFAIIILVQKLLLLLIIRYHFKDFPLFVKKIISTYLYNDYKL